MSLFLLHCTGPHHLNAILQVKATIDLAEEVAFRVKFLQDYLVHSQTNGFVLSISGARIPAWPDASAK